MMSIIAILAIALTVGAALLWGAKMPASARVPVASALMVGLAGYLLFGRPGVPAAPRAAANDEGFGEELQDPRQGLTERFGPAGPWLAMSDGMIRSGRTELGARTLAEGLRRHPRDINLWVAYGNALVAHSGGLMTPAAAMAFDRAAAIDPTHPAPPFFAGLALAQGGDVEGARRVWQALLDRAPADAPFRSDLEARLAAMPPPAPAAGRAPTSLPRN